MVDMNRGMWRTGNEARRGSVKRGTWHLEPLEVRRMKLLCAVALHSWPCGDDGRQESRAGPASVGDCGGPEAASQCATHGAQVNDVSGLAAALI